MGTVLGRGIATHAARELCDFAFRTLDINRICASALEVNVGSWRVMEKLGMRREGSSSKQSIWTARLMTISIMLCFGKNIA